MLTRCLRSPCMHANPILLIIKVFLFLREYQLHHASNTFCQSECNLTKVGILFPLDDPEVQVSAQLN